MPGKLSALVIAYNRAELIGTCLRGLAFADEIVVVDKSSTDATPTIAAQYANRLISVSWTQAVEDTRAFAVAQCSGDWILCLDDDECLSPDAGSAIYTELAAPRGDIYYLPLRHYILGVHDEAAYYWPEHHPRLFRRGAVRFNTTVHGGTQLCSDRTVHLTPACGVVIHHLSHRDVADWLSKCNRYTSRPDRRRPDDGGQDLAAFAHARIDHWQARTDDPHPGGYPATVAVLRAVYDIVDQLKTWEEERGLDGAAAFASVCAALDAGYAAPPAARGATLMQGTPPPPPPVSGAAAALQARIAGLRQLCTAATAEGAQWRQQAEQLRAGLDQETARHAGTAAALAAERRDRESAQAAADTARRQLAAIEASTFWRASAGVRWLVEGVRRMVRRGRPADPAPAQAAVIPVAQLRAAPCFPETSMQLRQSHSALGGADVG